MANEHPYCTWNNIAPIPDTWLDFAYKNDEWVSWLYLFRLSEIDCPSIEVLECGELYGDRFPSIVVYNQSNNLNSLRLLEAGIPFFLDSISKIELRLDTGQILSSMDYPEQIDWSVGEETEGFVFLRLGELPEEILSSRVYFANLVVFDMVHTDPTFWGSLRIRVLKELGNG